MLGLPRSLWGEVARFGFVIQGLSLWVVVGRSFNSLVFGLTLLFRLVGGIACENSLEVEH